MRSGLGLTAVGGSNSLTTSSGKLCAMQHRAPDACLVNSKLSELTRWMMRCKAPVCSTMILLQVMWEQAQGW